MCSLINKQLLLTAYAYLFIMEQQKGQQGSEALRINWLTRSWEKVERNAKGLFAEISKGIDVVADGTREELGKAEGNAMGLFDEMQKGIDVVAHGTREELGKAERTAKGLFDPIGASIKAAASLTGEQIKKKIAEFGFTRILEHSALKNFDAAKFEAASREFLEKPSGEIKLELKRVMLGLENKIKADDPSKTSKFSSTCKEILGKVLAFPSGCSKSRPTASAEVLTKIAANIVTKKIPDDGEKGSCLLQLRLGAEVCVMALLMLVVFMIICVCSLIAKHS